MIFPFYRGGNSNLLKMLPGRVEIRPKESTCRCRRLRFYPWVRKILWKREWLPTLVFLPGEFYRQRLLCPHQGYTPGDCKELDMTE